MTLFVTPLRLNECDVATLLSNQIDADTRPESTWLKNDTRLVNAVAVHYLQEKVYSDCNIVIQIVSLALNKTDIVSYTVIIYHEEKKFEVPKMCANKNPEISSVL
ncbi:hypothetical protein NDU88_008417 [Pleurodeles waltl]|uniref:Uncharacterized protein n=1 Tax=Pleurodeles waltl TaxID=8319 RepID=A0AAV7P0U8_PLEWA|nr:hypothetical protein NDU88_008417 [Pleurodeles waltl]